jgi:hypothetical protein
MKIEDNVIIVEDKDLPFTDDMSKTECYAKGAYDFAQQVKQMAKTARENKEQHSFMYHGMILDSLINNLDNLTDNIINSVKPKNQ